MTSTAPRGGPGAECRVGKFRRVVKRPGGPVGHYRLESFGMVGAVVWSVRRTVEGLCAG